MGQSQARPKPLATKPGGHNVLGDPLRKIQASVQKGKSNPTGVERFFGAPRRNKQEIRRITERFRGDITKEVNYTLRGFKQASQLMLEKPVGGMREFPSATGMLDYFTGQKARRNQRDLLISDALKNEIRKLARQEPKITYRDKVVGMGTVPVASVPDTPQTREYIAKANILRIQVELQVRQLLMRTTSRAEKLKAKLEREERMYQERLQGFRSGWVIGTAFVAVKQGVERILNDPVLRKAYLETFAVPVSLIPVIGPLIARIMRAAATDMNFDIGDFLRELFAEGVGTVIKVMAMAALGSALPPGISQGLRKVAMMGAGLITSSVGSRGASSLVRNVNKEKKKLDETAKQSVKKVAG